MESIQIRFSVFAQMDFPWVKPYESTDEEDKSKQFGGIPFQYGLKREQANLALRKVPTQEFQFTITEVQKGQGCLRLPSKLVADGTELDVWLFADQNPRYLTLIDILDFCKGAPMLATCRPRASNPKQLFLIDLVRLM